MGDKIDTVDPIFQCLLEKHENADTKQINPLEDYEVSETELGKFRPSGGFMPPSTLYLDISVEGCNNTNGLSGKNSIRAQFFGEGPLLSFTHQEGLFQIGVPVTEFASPWFGIGNIYYQPGESAAFGWFSADGSPNPYLIGLGGVIVLIQSIFSECKGAKECGADFLSRLTQASLPINVGLELIQNAGIDTKETACKDVWDKNSFTECIAYSAAYKQQARHEAAYDMVEEGLKKKRLDPHAAALLMAEKDDILASKNQSGLTPMRLPIIGPIFKKILEQPSARIADNVMLAAFEAKSFMAKHAAWLSKNEGPRPTEEEIFKFMADSLYLLLKLQVSAHVADRQINIRGSAPIAFRKAEDIAVFLETTAEVYNTIAVSKSLWSFVAARTSELARAVVKNSVLRSTESVLNAAFELSNLFTWKSEVSSILNHSHFEFRKAHLLWKLKKDFPENKDEYLPRIRNIKLADREQMHATISDAFSAISNIEDLNVYGWVKIFYDYLDKLFLISEEDISSEIKGLDFRGLAGTPSVHSGFELYYNFLKLESELEQKGKIDESQAYIIYHHLDILLQRIVKNRAADIKTELATYGPDIRDLRYEAVSASEKLRRKFENEAANNLIDFSKMLETGKIDSIDKLMAIEKRELDEKEALVGTVEANLRYLESGKGFDKESFDEISKLIGEYRRAFEKFSSYRNGIITMRIYTGKNGK
ncbi:MAG: hypothetical protein HYT75_02645 [Deltaproteobacteria bacterium]|nr:hypothetical protein [Deltaproteobacteria bacterium]